MNECRKAHLPAHPFLFCVELVLYDPSSIIALKHIPSMVQEHRRVRASSHSVPVFVSPLLFDFLCAWVGWIHSSIKARTANISSLSSFPKAMQYRASDELQLDVIKTNTRT